MPTKYNSSVLLIFVTSLLLVQGCTNKTKHSSPSQTDPNAKKNSDKNNGDDNPTPPTSVAPTLIDLEAIDKTTKPCDDFYQFACGGWIAKATIPADRPVWGRSLDFLGENNFKILNEILVSYQAGGASITTKYSKKLGDFYASCMDEAKIEKDSRPVLDGILKKIDAISNTQTLPSILAELHLILVKGFFEFYTDANEKDSTQMMGVIRQGGMAFGNPADYTSTDPKKVENREKYLQTIVRLLMLAGTDETVSKSTAQEVLALETALASQALSNAQLRDATKTLHPTERAELKTLAPLFDWDAYFGTLELAGIKAVNLPSLDYVKNLNVIFGSTPIATLRNYLRFQTIRSLAPNLSRSFREANFDFFLKHLTGQAEQTPRWKTCTNLASAYFGEALGESFAKLRLGEEGKASVKKITSEIRIAFGKELESTNWLDKPTQDEAIKKLNKMGEKIGSPDQIRNYDDLVVNRDVFLQNLINSRQFDNRFKFAQLNKPADKTLWGYPAQTVNASFAPNRNDITLPAGILQAPVFSVKATAAENFGSLGGIIGHEITHGFDDQGRKYDAEGNYHSWWTPSVETEFSKRAACLVKQYSAYEVLPEMKIKDTKIAALYVNGDGTLGENLADNGGVKVSYLAYRALTKDTQTPKIGEYNGDQQFFLAAAQVWCSKRTEGYERNTAANDPHTTPRYRVNGVVSNLPQFAEAFGCKEGVDKMAPKDRCAVW